MGFIESFLRKEPIDLGSTTATPLCSPLGEGLMWKGKYP